MGRSSPDPLWPLHHDDAYDDDREASVERKHDDVADHRQDRGAHPSSLHLGHVDVPVLVRGLRHLTREDGDEEHEDHLAKTA